MCSASSSTRSVPGMTSSSIASPKSSGKRDMWAPFWSASRSTKQSITADHQRLPPLWCMRTAFSTPVTPTRERPSRTSGAEAWRSGEVSTLSAIAGKGSTLRRAHDAQFPSPRRYSRATTCGRRSRPSTGSPGHSSASRSGTGRPLRGDDRPRRRSRSQSCSRSSPWIARIESGRFEPLARNRRLAGPRRGSCRPSCPRIP